MTRQEIIEMARQAGFLDYEFDDGTTDAFDKRYEAFATLVASAERDRMCEQFNLSKELAHEKAKSNEAN